MEFQPYKVEFPTNGLSPYEVECPASGISLYAVEFQMEFHNMQLDFRLSLSWKGDVSIGSIPCLPHSHHDRTV